MKQLIAMLFALLMIVPLAACGSKPAEAEIYAMDTVMNLAAYGDQRQAAVDGAAEELQRLEALLSRTDSSSEVSHINQTAGQPVSVSEETAALIGQAKLLSAATGGAFDPTVAPIVSAWGFTTDHYQVPSQRDLDSLLPLVDSSLICVSGQTVSIAPGQSMDLGGIAKGYASDRVETIFREHGISSGKAALGGNIYVRGSKPDGTPWRVAVQDPSNSAAYVGILSLRDAFAVTSGGYQRYFEQNGQIYHHIIDPATGYPANSGLLSVTVVAPENGDSSDTRAYGHGAMCDAFSTALFVMGTEKAVDFWRTADYDFDLVLVTDDGRVLFTQGLAEEFEGNEDSDYAYEIIR